VTGARATTLAAVALGVLLLIVALVYFIEGAKDLPSFFPGHDASSSHVHVKHGLAALIVGLGCFVFAWFRTGPRTGAAS
jgi:divalent metal cation (Fe/Co/Zn/Cd) transporter